MRISARNQLAGVVETVELGAVSAIVTIRLAGGEAVVASITRESAERLELAPGKPATAVIKSSDVMVALAGE